MLLSRSAPNHEGVEVEDDGGMMQVSLAAHPSPRQVPNSSSNTLLRRFLVVLVAGSILSQSVFLFPSTTPLREDVSSMGSLQQRQQRQAKVTSGATTTSKPVFTMTVPTDTSEDSSVTAADAEVTATLIPRRLIFTYKWDVLERHEPRHFYKNVQKTIQGYKDYWKQQYNNSSSSASSSPVVVSFLNDTTCERLIEQVAPALLPHFQEEKLGSYRSDICRLAALYRHGGYYFDIDMELVQPMVAPPAVSFLTVQEANSNGFFFQSFLATTPGHPVVHRALTTTLPAFYAHRRHDASAPHVWMGPYTLHQAYYHRETENTTTKSLLLSEVNLDDHPRSTTRRRKGHGCCCNYVVQHAGTVYFYSRMVGAGPHCEL